MDRLIAWKRYLLLLVFVHAFGLLVSCGGNDNSSSPAPPAIAAQPVSTTVVAGQAANFSVTGTGDGLGFQWQRSVDNGATFANIAGATASTFSIATVDVTLSGSQYRVVITGTGGTLTSSAVTLTVTPAPTPAAITTQPTDQTATAGGSVAFSVTATGTSLTYQWQSSTDGTTYTAIAGATSATLTLSAVTVSISGSRYRVVVSNSVSTVTSNAVLLTVNAAPLAPSISTQPAAVSVAAGQAATFTVAAAGAPSVIYQWQLSTDGGVTYTDIDGAISAIFTITITSIADNGHLFRVRVYNTIGSIFSNGVPLVVTPAPAPPVIAGQPADVTVTALLLATFQVVATGIPTPTYQWQLSTDGGITFTNINGATSQFYSTNATTSADNGKKFRVIVSNSAGTVTSNAATLTVLTSTLAGFPDGLVLSSSDGNLYVGIDVAFAGVQRVTLTGGTTSIAGSTFGGFQDGTGSAALFNVISGVGADSAGTIYVADSNAIRKVTATGVVTTLAGTRTQGYVDGSGSVARFQNPLGIAVDGSGNVFVADTDNNVIRRVTPNGTVTTYAGAATSGFVDGPALLARFSGPQGIAIDSSGTLYVLDFNNQAIRKISSLGIVTTLSIQSSLALGGEIALDAAGNIYTSDQRTLYKITPAGVISVLAGGVTGFLDGNGVAAQFNGIRGIAVDGSGNVYVSDARNKAVRKVTPAGVVTTVAH